MLQTIQCCSHDRMRMHADVQLTTEEYRLLEASTLNRLQEMRTAIATQRSQRFGKEFVEELRRRQGQAGRFWSLPQQDGGGQQMAEACMGCGRPSTVKIAKICETCPERAEVRTLSVVTAAGRQAYCSTRFCSACCNDRRSSFLLCLPAFLLTFQWR